MVKHQKYELSPLTTYEDASLSSYHRTFPQNTLPAEHSFISRQPHQYDTFWDIPDRPIGFMMPFFDVMDDY